jgi:hypothetical protein
MSTRGPRSVSALSDAARRASSAFAVDVAISYRQRCAGA